MDYEHWLEQARESIKNNIELGSTFELKQLFNGFEWEQLSTGHRKSFGSYFSNAVKSNQIPEIVRIERGKNNHARYKKIKNISEL